MCLLRGGRVPSDEEVPVLWAASSLDILGRLVNILGANMSVRALAAHLPHIFHL